MKRNNVIKLVAGIGGALLLAALLVVANVIPSPFDMIRRGPPQQDMAVDKKMRAEILESLITNLNQYYIFPEQAKKIETTLRAKMRSGAYDSVTSAETFASTLTADIQQVTNDRHLDVAYSEKILTKAEFEEEAQSEPSAEQIAELKRLNYGVHSVDRLKFNIGYLDIHAFAPADHVATRFAAAMTLMADTHSLIIDLRANHGGEPETVALLASYLFDKRTRLNDIYLRDGDQTLEGWTQENVAGPKYGSTRKVYLLIGPDTFSAGEDFAYALKNLKRATLIGKATGGGAHPGGPRRLNEHFAVMVPSGRSISPITHTDWEGVGVTPDIEKDPEDALDAAQLLILKDQLMTEKNEILRERIKESIAELD